MDSRESAAAQPAQHLQQPPPSQHHHLQSPQVMMMAPPLNSYTPQITNNTNNGSNNNGNNNNIDSSSSTLIQHDSNLFPFNSGGPKQLDSINSQYTDGSAGFNMEPARKKRGRPRKYSADGNISLGLSPVTPVAVGGHGDSGGGGTGAVTAVSESSSKKGRGRPPGSGKKQLDALGTYGVGFTPHVIIVKQGEDVASKIVAFSQQGPRTICILSANGALCKVTLRQPETSGGSVTYEGRFEIISLSGSLSMSDSNGNNNQTSGLSVSLAGTDSRVLGGGVAGALVAVTPVQVIVGSFIADGKKPKSGLSPAPPPHMLNFGSQVPAASPPSEGGSSESSDESGSSPLNQDPGSYSNTSQPMPPMYANMAWSNPTMNMLPN